jgi:two-component system CheB/CheR fusion protein
MIYMSVELQKKIIPLFHYSLYPDGFLFLGTSETVGEFGDLFAVLDRKSKLYQCKEGIHSVQRVALDRFLPPMTALDAAVQRTADKKGVHVKMPLRELTEQALLQQIAPAGALVNSHGDILYIHGRTGMYMEPAPGEAGINNILKMAREGLRRELTTALHKAASRKEIMRFPGLRVKTNGDFTTVNLTICPVEAGPAATPGATLYLVILEKAQTASIDSKQAQQAALYAGAGADGHGTDADARIEALKQELQAKEEYLQTSNEELETSNEELKSSNEEMQSVNEELQSTNEELETSREELQSVNEELATVNNELQTKVADLSRSNNDMNNLLAGTGIGTIFLDVQLRIMRFTPAAAQIINMIQTDVGRPVGHIVSNLVGYDSLLEDAQTVLDTLVPKEVEVQTSEGKWHTMRILPYRTIDNVIEGAVITFVDITEMKKAQEGLRKANDLLRLAVVVHDSYDAITVQDLDGSILAWNPGAVRMYGWSEAEALAMNVRDRLPKSNGTEELTVINQLAESQVLETYRTRRIAKDGTDVEVWMTSTALVNEAGQMYAIATTERGAGTKNETVKEAHSDQQG